MMGKFFDDIKEGLEEAIAFEQGKTTLRTRFVELPQPPAKYTSRDIKKIREEKDLSQSVFALYLKVSVKTVRSWESGERVPSQCALRLLELIDKEIFMTKPVRKQPCGTLKRKTQPKLASQGENLGRSKRPNPPQGNKGGAEHKTNMRPSNKNKHQKGL